MNVDENEDNVHPKSNISFFLMYLLNVPKEGMGKVVSLHSKI